MADKNKDKILRNTLIAMLGGTALVSGVNLHKHLKDIGRRDREEAARKAEVIEIPVVKTANTGGRTRRRTGPDSNELLAQYALPVLGGTGVFLLGRKLYQNAKAKSLAEELDQVQRAYYARLAGGVTPEESAEAAALLSSEGMGKSAKATLGTQLNAGFKGLLGTLFLGGALMAPRLLDRQFPVKTKEVPVRRVRVTKVTPDIPDIDEGDTEDAEMEKNASYGEDFEFLYTVLLGNKKQASDSGLEAVAQYVATGGVDNFETVLMQDGVDRAIDLACTSYKGGTATPMKKVAAVFYLAHNPLTREALSPVVASEFMELAPTLCKIASDIPDSYHDEILTITRTRMMDSRNTELYDMFKPEITGMTKEASTGVSNMGRFYVLEYVKSKLKDQ